MGTARPNNCITAAPAEASTARTLQLRIQGQLDGVTATRHEDVQQVSQTTTVFQARQIVGTYQPPAPSGSKDSPSGLASWMDTGSEVRHSSHPTGSEIPKNFILTFGSLMYIWVSAVSTLPAPMLPVV